MFQDNCCEHGSWLVFQDIWVYKSYAAWMSCIGTQDRSLLRLSRVLRLEILQECIVCVRPTLLVQWTLLVHCISVVCIPPKPDLFIQVALQLFMVIWVSWTKLVHIFCSCTWTSMLPKITHHFSQFFCSFQCTHIGCLDSYLHQLFMLFAPLIFDLLYFS